MFFSLWVVLTNRAKFYSSVLARNVYHNHTAQYGKPIAPYSLYMPALSAKEHDPHVKAYFQHLVDNGKLPLQAVCAVMRKLLHAIHGMLKHNQPFDNARFYAIPISENS
jgi:hypothetical protein